MLPVLFLVRRSAVERRFAARTFEQGADAGLLGRPPTERALSRAHWPLRMPDRLLLLRRRRIVQHHNAGRLQQLLERLDDFDGVERHCAGRLRVADAAGAVENRSLQRLHGVIARGHQRREGAHVAHHAFAAEARWSDAENNRQEKIGVETAFSTFSMKTL